jgi:voltage-gated potassium channel
LNAFGGCTILSRWEKLAEWPLTVAALAFLVAYAAPIIDTELPSAAVYACKFLTWGIWALFAADYVVRLMLAERRWRYAAKHWLDLLVIALPLLRPLRLLRLISLLKVLNRRATAGLRGQVAIYVAGGAALLVFCGALAVLDAEQGNPDANIHTFGDALWWAMSTTATVGYGDRYPTTGQGRLAAAALMVGGIGLIGAVTATLASWLVERVQVVEREQTADLGAELERLHTRLNGIERALVEPEQSHPVKRKPDRLHSVRHSGQVRPRGRSRLLTRGSSR